jgi:hypothetical protein
MHQQLWVYKVEEKLNLGVSEQKRLNTTALDQGWTTTVSHLGDGTITKLLQKTLLS